MAEGRAPRRRTIWWFERSLQARGFGLVAGVDEAGRGACAGPLVVAAVVLPAYRGAPAREWAELDDSKVLSPAVRERLAECVRNRALAVSVVVVPEQEVDRRGVHVADLAAMRQAVATLSPAADYALTDGFPVAGMPVPSLALWKGDQTAACVAAASITAKVTRDCIMAGLDQQFPGYGFAEHKGYATPAHLDALRTLGCSPVHRQSFVTVRRAERSTQTSLHAQGPRDAAQWRQGGGR